MRIWHEGDTLYYDLEYHGIRPQWIVLESLIISAELNGEDVRVQCETGELIVKNIREPKLTRVDHHEIP